ncbi:MAG: DUF2726 domain-containing protein [Pseudomonadota bacterium]
MTLPLPRPIQRVVALLSLDPTPSGSERSNRVSGFDALAGASVGTGPLMSQGQNDMFQRLCDLANPRGFHVAPEVSLGAIFTIQGAGEQGSGAEAIRALRHKTVDFLLLDGSATPVMAIEYRGESRWRDKALKRDRLKRRAFEKAGLSLVELRAPEDWDEDLATIATLLDEGGKPGARDRHAA